MKEGTINTRALSPLNTTATETMIRIKIKIQECEHELHRLSGFSDADCRNEALGKHIDAVKQHLDNASGRMSSAIMATRLSK
jgi:hypothetical protein